MRSKIIKILLICLAFPIYGISGIFSTPVNIQAGEYAKQYLEKKYEVDFFVSSSNFCRNENSGECLVNLHPINESVAYCQIDVLFDKPGEFYIKKTKPGISPDSCGDSIVNYKFKSFIKNKIVPKYYKEEDISLGASLDDLDFSENCTKLAGCRGRDKSIFDTNGNWNLSIEELLHKYYDDLGVKSIGIILYNQPKSAESIAKAMELAYVLNKYLHNLTGSHKIGKIYIYIYDISKEFYNKKYKDNPAPFTYRENIVFGDGGAAIEYIPITKSNIFDFVRITSSDRKSVVNIKNTEYYQPVKRLIEQSQVIK